LSLQLQERQLEAQLAWFISEIEFSTIKGERHVMSFYNATTSTSSSSSFTKATHSRSMRSPVTLRKVT